MSDEAQGLEFTRYAWRERKLVLATCGIALVLTGGVSLLLPKQYTATSSILIEPPAGNDPRAAVALSQVYLESLKTYEQFATGDTLFSAALNDLGLRAQFGDTSVETLKRRILAVSLPTNATYIQVAVTLNNPKDAQRLAQYIGERAVDLNDTLDQQTSSAMIAEPKKLFLAAKARRVDAEKAAEQLAGNGSLDALEKEFTAASELRTEVGRDLARARADLANYVGQLQTPPPISTDSSSPPQSAWTQYEVSAAKARVQDLEKQETTLLAFLQKKGPALEAMRRARESVDSELKSARTVADATEARLAEIQTSVPFRGVRLKVLDPGIVPQRPSFPNIPLNLGVALALSLLLSTGYLTIRFAQSRLNRVAPEADYSWR